MPRDMGVERLPIFDLSKARGPRQGPDVGRDPAGKDTDKTKANEPKMLSVSSLIASVKDALAEAFPQSVTVVGELSNVKHHTSGHLYFRLKDETAAIDAAMFRGYAGKLKFRPEDGLEVVLEGRVDVYDVRGQLQLYVERMTPKGSGALELAFRQLREKLHREGLFDPGRKKAIPRFPRAIGVVTSPTGAAIRDIRRTLGRRWPAAKVYLLGVLVQGASAAEEIARAVRLLDANAGRYEIDTIIVARGGGSLEDLWAFNEPAVARAIFSASVPVISGVGHETDVTIADLVADLRAPTPTAAAELAAPDAEEIRRHVANLAGRLARSMAEDIAAGRSALKAIHRSVVFRDPAGRFRVAAQRVDELSHRLRAGMIGHVTAYRRRLEPAGVKLAGLHPRHRLKLARQQISAAARQLEAMSYRNVLRRGFAVTRDASGKILRSAAGVRTGDGIETELADGKIRSVVKVVNKAAKKTGTRPDPDAASARPQHKPPSEAQRTLFE
ncbi:MAG: exodeoxyribonuclease VII large subunit [Planctomycetota bacterium]|nr:exodeoxyribonuclease VII large subunit [Planctomycetota bacterium]